jgi:hypothetical protein
MNKKEIIEDVTKSITLFHEFIEAIRSKEVERGYISEFDNDIKRKKGIYFEDTKTNEYNFYTYEQFKAIMNFITQVTKTKFDIVGIKDRHVYYFYINFCTSIIDTADRILSEQLLFPILSYLSAGEVYDKNRYIINVY